MPHNGRGRVATEVPPARGKLVMHNAPAHCNREPRVCDYRFILNACDPRDLQCNQYHWQFSHPFLEETPVQKADRRVRFAAMGMDAWGLAQDLHPVLQGFLDVV